MKTAFNFVLFFVVLFSCGCASTTRLNFNCNDPSVDIYINGEYAGRNIVNYAFPKSKQFVEVSCFDNGVEVFHRTFYVKSYSNNELIDLQPQQDLQYSTSERKAKTR